ncbi:unnamed protein product, partial [Prunus brigantina]
SIGITTIAINLARDLQVAIFKATSHSEREARIEDHHRLEPSINAWFKGGFRIKSRLLLDSSRLQSWFC